MYCEMKCVYHGCTETLLSSWGKIWTTDIETIQMKSYDYILYEVAASMSEGFIVEVHKQ